MTERSFRRIVTGHDKAGRAIILEDRAPVRVFDNLGQAGLVFHEVWNTRGTPARIDRAGGEPEEDGIVLDGEITLIVDDGEATLYPGDICIQRGTNHGWINCGKKPCRIAFILIDGVWDADIAQPHQQPALAPKHLGRES